MNTAYLSLGSNLGDRSNLLKVALETLVSAYPIELVNVSLFMRQIR